MEPPLLMRGRGNRTYVVLAIAVLGALALSVAAHGSPTGPSFFKYRVIEQGSGTYSYDSAQYGVIHVRSNYEWRVRFRNILVPKRPVGIGGDIAQITIRKASSAGGYWSIENQGGSGDCSRSGPLSLARGDDVAGAIEGHRGQKGLRLALGPGWLHSSAPYTSDICSGGNFWQAWPILASGAGSAPNGGVFNDPLAAAIKIPSRDLGKNRISVSLGPANQTSLYQPFERDCSGGGDPCTQSFDWSATLTLVRLPT